MIGIGYDLSDSDSSRTSSSSCFYNEGGGGLWTVTQDFVLKTAGATIAALLRKPRAQLSDDSLLQVHAQDVSYDEYETEIESTDYLPKVEAGGSIRWARSSLLSCVRLAT